jgi:hypothetical protein
MEQVEDVLRTLLGPDDRFRTVRATIRHSRDVDLERRSAGIGRPSFGRDNQQRQTPRRRLPTRAQEDDLIKGIDLLVVAFRLERQFGVKVSPDQYSKMAMRNDPPDIRVGDLFDFIRGEVPRMGVLDLELDADALWPMFQREISDALGVDLEEVTKDKGLIHDLGAV